MTLSLYTSLQSIQQSHLILQLTFKMLGALSVQSWYTKGSVQSFADYSSIDNGQALVSKAIACAESKRSPAVLGRQHCARQNAPSRLAQSVIYKHELVPENSRCGELATFERNSHPYPPRAGLYIRSIVCTCLCSFGTAVHRCSQRVTASKDVSVCSPRVGMLHKRRIERAMRTRRDILKNVASPAGA